MPAKAHYEIAIVGGGFRATALLASEPALQERRIAVIERRGALGGGDFRDYWTNSTSAGNRFVKDADPTLAAFGDPVVASVTSSAEPVELPALARALDLIGKSVLQSSPDISLLPKTADEVHLEERAVSIRLDDGSSVSAQHVILATGRHELLSQQLIDWEHKLVRSSDFLARDEPTVVSRSLEHSGAIVIAGSAHSSMSVLRKILAAAGDVRYQGREIIVTRRSPMSLHYADLGAAIRGQVPGRERLVNDTSICRLTGIVHRDSGLRGESRELYLRLWDGEIPYARLLDIDHLDDASESFDRSALIIQALGYVGRSPIVIDQDGTIVRAAEATTRFPTTPDGRAIVRDQPSTLLSVLRIDPTPPELRDHAAYGQGLNRELASRVLQQLRTDGAT